jgi:hypothetical protein
MSTSAEQFSGERFPAKECTSTFTTSSSSSPCQAERRGLLLHRQVSSSKLDAINNGKSPQPAIYILCVSRHFVYLFFFIFSMNHTI